MKIRLLVSDPHSVMPLIKLIIGASVPSLPRLNPSHTHTDMCTHLVLQSEIALGLLGLRRVSIQLVEPRFELPQALSLLSLGGQDARVDMKIGECKEYKKKNYEEQRSKRGTDRSPELFHESIEGYRQRF